MKKILILIAISAAFMACTKESNPDNSIDGQMAFTMSVGSKTKATATEFEVGDKVGLFVVEYNDQTPSPLQISGNWVNNVSATYDGAEWNPSKKIFWPEEKADVYGYYPYMSVESVDAQTFAVSLNQNTIRDGETLGGYEASDFLWAKASGVSQDQEVVELNYKHIMSKVVVKLVKGDDFEGDFPETGELYIHNLTTEADIDLSSGTVVKSSTAKTATIKARTVNAETFEAIVVPQRIETRRPLFEYVANGISYLLEDVFYFRNGKQHILELMINTSPEQIEVEIGCEISEEWK